MIIFGGGLAVIFTPLGLLYRRALRKRRELELTDFEAVQTAAATSKYAMSWTSAAFAARKMIGKSMRRSDRMSRAERDGIPYDQLTKSIQFLDSILANTN